MGCGASQPAGAAYIDEAIVKDAAAAAKATTPSPAPKDDPPPLPLAEAQEKAQSFRRRKLSYDTMDPNAITTDGKVDEGKLGPLVGLKSSQA